LIINTTTTPTEVANFRGSMFVTDMLYLDLEPPASTELSQGATNFIGHIVGIAAKGISGPGGQASFNAFLPETLFQFGRDNGVDVTGADCLGYRTFVELTGSSDGFFKLNTPTNQAFVDSNFDIDGNGSGDAMWRFRITNAKWSRQVLAFGQSSPAQPNFSGSDNFNDNQRDTSKWGIDEVVGSGLLIETNSSLVYHTTGGSSADDTGERPWIANFGSYTQDWTVQVDVNLPDLSLTAGQKVQMAIKVFNRSDSTDLADVALEISGGPSATRRFSAEVETNDTQVASNSVVTTGTSVALRINWTSTTHTLTMDYDADGPGSGSSWAQLLSSPLDSEAANWGMTNSSTFGIIMLAESANRGITLTDGIRFDNFQAFTPVARPDLFIVKSNSDVVVSWATNANGFTLKSTGDFSVTNNPVWNAVTNGVVVQGQSNTVTVSTTTTNKYFRLESP